MTIEELLQHPRVHHLDIRYVSLFKGPHVFVIYAHILDSHGWPNEKPPSEGNTLQEAVNKVAKKLDHSFKSGG
jgi:hypothetical protein